jgi:hypothetical protein
MRDLEVNENNVNVILQQFLELKAILGNIHGNIHFLARYSAYAYLQKVHDIRINLEKAECESGLDIDEKGIVGEIKTTIPYNSNDFGAKQKEEITKDLELLEKTSAWKKYFFVIDEKTERILIEKYMNKYPSVVLVNLLRVQGKEHIHSNAVCRLDIL